MFVWAKERGVSDYIIAVVDSVSILQIIEVCDNFLHRKNWERLVFGPALAIERTPGPVLDL
jgi:hypothetical protein